MLDFVNVELFKEMKVIDVTVFSTSVERAKKQIYKLIEDEGVVMLKESEISLDVQVLKKHRFIRVHYVHLSHRSRGYRNNYALVDSADLFKPDGFELFTSIVRYKNIFSCDNLVDEKVKPVSPFMIF